MRKIHAGNVRNLLHKTSHIRDYVVQYMCFPFMNKNLHSFVLWMSTGPWLWMDNIGGIAYAKDKGDEVVLWDTVDCSWY